MLTIFELWMPGDCEGRTSRVVARFTDANVADAIGRTGFGNMLMAHRKGEVKPLHIYETAEEFYRANPEADITKYRGDLDTDKILRERALAKLTPEEQSALGVGEP